jgi:lipopolysaccharide transport system ATP-binding protein
MLKEAQMFVDSDPPFIETTNVSVKFCRDLKRSLWYGLQDIALESVGKGRAKRVLRKDEFWAVRDVSFSLRRGDCLGLIGPNGAGKSTLLKVLNGLFKLDEGTIRLRGRVGALIELGTGFNTVLTGRENVYINGSVLGLTRQEIDRKFDRIVEFSEIGEFIDAPVRSYSSGMAVRLAFAIAAQMEPDILLLDEVLAVGDVGFRSKCYTAMQKILSRAAVVFVSHSMPQIARLCNRLIVLNRGKVIYQGDNVPEGIDRYYGQFSESESTTAGTGRATLQQVRLSSNGSHSAPNDILIIDYLSPLSLEIVLSVENPIKQVQLGLLFYDRETRGIAQCNSENGTTKITNQGEPIRLQVKIPQVPFNPGRYSLSITVTDEETGEILVSQYAAREFHVTGSFFGFTPIQLEGSWKILPHHKPLITTADHPG